MRSDKYRKRKKRGAKIAVAAIAAVVVLAGAAVWFFFLGNVRSELRTEAGSPVPSAEEFIRRPNGSIEILRGTDSIDGSTPGKYTVSFRWLFLKKNAHLVIEDTTPPAVTLRDVTAAVGSRVEPERFVVSAEDITGCSAAYQAEPDFSRESDGNVTIVLTDGAGNSTAQSARLTLVEDHEPPVIIGATNRTIYLGESIAYRSGVIVTDDRDKSPKLSIDNSQVNLDKVGRYPVTYTATDAVGNSSSVTVSISVEDMPSGYEQIEELNAKADALLPTILPAGSDQASGVLSVDEQIDRAYSIFRWIRTNVPWYGGRVNHNYVQQAINALNKNSGDCYTCTVGCKVLLERAGFEVMMLERKNAMGLHYWLMVKIGDNWYHMDPSPIYVQQFICFLGTDDQLRAFNELREGYYDHDWSQYPATPSESAADVVVKSGKYTLVKK